MHRWGMITVFCGWLVACGGASESGHKGADGVAPDAKDVSDEAATDVLPEQAGDTTEALAPDAIEDAFEDAIEAGDLFVEAEVDAGWTLPDPAFVHVRRADAPATSAGEAWTMDGVRQYRSAEEIPDAGVRHLAADDKMNVWAATASGLYRLDREQDRFVPQALPGGGGVEIVDLGAAPDGGGRLIVVTPERLDFVTPGGGGESIDHPGGTLTCAAAAGPIVYVGTTQGLRRLVGTFLELVPGTEGLHVLDLTVEDKGVWVVTMVTDQGVRVWDGSAVTAPELPSEAGTIRALTIARDATGSEFGSPPTLWLGAEKGVVGVQQGTPASLYTPDVGGLPSDDVRALVAYGDDLAVAHARGASLLTHSFTQHGWGRVEHYVSQRWLPDDVVKALAFDAAGTLWIGTDAGIAHIEDGTHTFAAREAAFEPMVHEHFWRMDGFVSSNARVDDAWAPTTWTNSDHDNDGLWTQMQIGAWCYAFAATGDARYRQAAKKAMDAMFLLIDVPAGDFESAGIGRGYVARSLVRDDEGALFDEKASSDRWHLTTYQGRQYYWKNDTSSDEVDGHWFGFPLYYDLCATADEKPAVAEHLDAMTRTIVAHGFAMVDLDGLPTTFAQWQPERLAIAVDGLSACYEKAKEWPDPAEYAIGCLGAWGGGGWLNSVQILGGLLATWHVTGDPLYYDAYERLIRDHRYDEVATPHDQTFTITNPAIMNHSDHELAMLAYHTLIRYEPNPERREKWISGLLFLYEHERGERNPLWAAFVSLLAGPEHADIEDALESLREIPLDRREWALDNSHRLDAGRWPDDRFGDPQFDRVFPYDEIKTVWWNTNLRDVTDGGDGRSVSGPMAWLLPYWALRYAHVIGE